MRVLSILEFHRRAQKYRALFLRAMKLARQYRSERDAARADADKLRGELTEARELLHTIHYGIVNAPARERWLRLMADATPTAAPQPTVCGHGCTTWCTTGDACPLAAVAGTGQQDTATWRGMPIKACNLPPSHTHHVYDVGNGKTVCMGSAFTVEDAPASFLRAAAVPPAADKADGNKA